MCQTIAVPTAAESPAGSFEDRFLNALNGAGLMLLTSLGHRAGLFSAMNGAPPMTSAELAERADLDERYVREWLGGMVAAGVVDTDPAAGTYTLPDEHAAVLTDDGEVNLAVYAQFIGVLGGAERRSRVKQAR